MTFSVSSTQDIQDILHGSGSFAITGSGTKSDFGPPVDADNVIETRSMAGIVDWSPDDLVVVAKAGTSIEELGEELKTRNQMLGVPTWTSKIGRLTAGIPGTLGGLVAANLPTRWESKCRGPRYWLLGATFVKADGTVIKCGSRAVKNVAGYDVQKLLVGSWGSLGVITEVILRTQALKHYTDEPQSHSNGDAPLCIVRTLPTELDNYIAANPIQDAVVDRQTATVWARALKPAAKPEDGWVINAGFGAADRQYLGDNEDLMRAIKHKVDPLNRFNPGRLF